MHKEIRVRACQCGALVSLLQTTLSTSDMRRGGAQIGMHQLTNTSKKRCTGPDNTCYCRQARHSDAHSHSHTRASSPSLRLSLFQCPLSFQATTTTTTTAAAAACCPPLPQVPLHPTHSISRVWPGPYIARTIEHFVSASLPAATDLPSSSPDLL